MKSTSALVIISRTNFTATSRHVGANAAIRFAEKYDSMMRRYAVCSGWSMPPGTDKCCDTALLKVS